MANGSDGPDGGRSADGLVRRFDLALQNRIVMLFIAVVLGSGSAVGIQSLKPTNREDAYTATMARERARLVDERLRSLDLLIERVGSDKETRLDALEILLAKAVEAQLSVREDIRDMRSDIRDLLRRMLIQEK